MLVKTNVDISIKNQPHRPPFNFCSNVQTRRIWNECFNWPDTGSNAAFCFHPRERKYKRKHKENGKFLILVFPGDLVT